MSLLHAPRGPVQQQRCCSSSTLPHSTCRQPSRLIAIPCRQEALRKAQPLLRISRLVIVHSQASSGSNADGAASTTTSNSSSSSQAPPLPTPTAAAPTTAAVPAAAAPAAAGAAAQPSAASTRCTPIDWQARRKQRVVDDLVDVSVRHCSDRWGAHQVAPSGATWVWDAYSRAVLTALV